MFGTVIVSFLAALAIFALYRLSRSYIAKVTLNPEGKIAPIIASMKSLTKPYKPTPWLINNHMHTIWGMKFRGKTSMKEEREEIKFEDGGTVIIDWFSTQGIKEDAPILFVVHTLGGGTREPCTNHMAVAAAKHGWRSVVATCRGCNGSPITSRRLYNALKTDDLHHVVQHASKKYPKAAHKYMVGFSLGSIMSVQYAVDFNDLEAIACISHPIDTQGSLEILEKPTQTKLYMPTIMKVLTRVVEKSTFFEGEQREKGIHAKTIREFDDAITSKELGLKDSTEYYEKISFSPKIAHVKVPLMMFNSDDDPFTSAKFTPQEEIKKSQFVAFVHTPEGGHVSFCQGMDGKGSYIENVVIDFFETTSKQNLQ